jgi:hypothetical protein
MSYSPTLSLETTFRRLAVPAALVMGLGLAGCSTTPRTHINPDSCERSDVTTYELGSTPVGTFSTGHVFATTRTDHGFSVACDKARRAVNLGMAKDPEKDSYISSALRVLIHFYNAAEAEVKKHVDARLSAFHKIRAADLPALELKVRKAELRAAGHNDDFACRVETDGVRRCKFIKEEEIKVDDPVTGASPAASAPPQLRDTGAPAPRAGS